MNEALQAVDPQPGGPAGRRPPGTPPRPSRLPCAGQAESIGRLRQQGRRPRFGRLSQITEAQSHAPRRRGRAGRRSPEGAHPPNSRRRSTSCSTAWWRRARRSSTWGRSQSEFPGQRFPRQATVVAVAMRETLKDQARALNTAAKRDQRAGRPKAGRGARPSRRRPDQQYPAHRRRENADGLNRAHGGGRPARCRGRCLVAPPRARGSRAERWSRRGSDNRCHPRSAAPADRRDHGPSPGRVTAETATIGSALREGRPNALMNAHAPRRRSEAESLRTDHAAAGRGLRPLPRTRRAPIRSGCSASCSSRPRRCSPPPAWRRSKTAGVAESFRAPPPTISMSSLTEARPAHRRRPGPDSAASGGRPEAPPSRWRWRAAASASMAAGQALREQRRDAGRQRRRRAQPCARAPATCSSSSRRRSNRVRGGQQQPGRRSALCRRRFSPPPCRATRQRCRPRSPARPPNPVRADGRRPDRRDAHRQRAGGRRHGCGCACR